MNLFRTVVVLGLLMGSGSGSVSGAPPSSIPAIINHLVQTQDTATLTDNSKALQSVYLPNSGEAQRVYRKALQRAAYLKDWAQARKVRFEGVSVHVRVGPIRWLSPDTVRVYGADQAAYRYRHLVGSPTLNQFGIGVYHWYTLHQREGRWYIQGDNFIDPLNQDTRLKGAAVPAVIQVSPEHRAAATLSAGAKKAIQFAEHYCGAAPGCGHNNRYHPEFSDYNWNGGDCTNFISQTLHAGGFSENDVWNGRNGGTAAWINATRFVQYLSRSGRATVFARGTLPSLIKPGSDGLTALDQLRPGDLIAYFETGRVVHNAIVVGFDSDGYPVVISHSADRYRVPWDLGWDRSTVYLFCHVHYPDSARSQAQAQPNNATSAVIMRVDGAR